MIHTYQSIPGWFDFQDVYENAVFHAPEVGARFCEVGNFMGRSLTFLAAEIINSGKGIELYSVDNMGDVAIAVPHCDPVWSDASRFNGMSQYEVLRSHLRPYLDAGLKWYHRVDDSAVAAGTVAEESFDFVFIDADHHYENVKKDLLAWWPKVKRGGRFAGHDHTPIYWGVERACSEVLGKYQVSGASWWLDK